MTPASSAQNKTRYYFDHNATTPVRPEVIEAMTPYLIEAYGNASSVHSFGREARNAIDTSRETVARLIGADTDEIFFTGCGTESDNIALAGVVGASKDRRNGVVTTSVEHSAVLKTAEKLRGDGYPVAIIGVDSECRMDMDGLRDAVGGTTALVSVMHANNETGVLQDIREAASIAHSAGALFHTDAVQSSGKIPIDVKALGIDLLSMSGHKLNAPKGIGVLYAKKGIALKPLTYGGSHERGLRPGTENVAGIVGFAAAFELSVREMDEKNRFIASLRDRLESGIEAMVEGALFNGRIAQRLSNTANVSIPGVDGEALIFSLDREGIAASTGSACSTGDVVPSHVLVAMGRAPKIAQSSLRFSLGRGSSGEGVDHVLEVLPEIVERLRKVSGGL